MNLSTYNKQKPINKDELFIRQMVKATKEHAELWNLNLIESFDCICGNVNAPYWNEIKKRLNLDSL